MSAKRINPRLIKLHRAYSVEDVSARLCVHKNTVRSWIKSGLSIVDQSRPTLILASELRRFLEAKQKARKRPCPPGTFYCFKCRAPKPPALGMVDYTPRNQVGGNLSALCGCCGTAMNRRAICASLPLIMPNLDVQIREASPRIS
jgi:hypothetical protein